MSPTVKTLTASPGASLSAMYTVPPGRRANIKQLQATNISGTGVTFRLAISPEGASIADAHYLAYDMALQANDYEAWAGIVLGAGDVVRVYGSDANVSFFLSVYEDDA